MCGTKFLGRVGVLAVALGAAGTALAGAPAHADDTPTTASAETARHPRAIQRPAERVRRPANVRRPAAVPRPAAAVLRPATSLSPGREAATAASPTASATANPLGALFDNARPSLRPVRIGQSATGVVTGDLGLTDPDSTPVSVTVTTPPTHGTLDVDAAGRYTYTPDPALARTGYTDTFVVTASDADSGFHLHGLAGLLNLLTFGLIGSAGHTSITTASVTVNPVNSAPVATLFLGDTEALTGVVRGAITARDDDADPLAFTVAGATKGAVTVAADGTLAYTPTAEARHTAAATGATAGQKSDTFTITVDDGYGGSVTVPVAVTIAGVNTPPVLAPSATSPDATTGLVIVSLNATDADGDPLSYAVTGASRGTLAVGADGGFSYVPTAVARHAAAAPGGVTADTATVTVSDGNGATVTVPVSVPIAPTNTAPTGAVAVGQPDGSGRVTGAFTAADADGDVLTFTATVSGKGAVVITPDGAFTYTPTATARHRAAALNAGAADTSDSFTLTAADGHGGAVDAAVTVAIVPANETPTATTTIGMPDFTTGLVAGAVLGSDADADELTYAVSAAGKGTVILGDGGAFTYTPAALARHAAGLATATSADLTDTFAVTVSDGCGGTVVVPVTVAIAPAGITFDFVYGSGSQYWSAGARSALEAAADNLASAIVVSVPVTLSFTVVGESAANSGLLANMYAYYGSSAPGIHGTVAQTKALTGVDANAGTPEGTITWNFAYPWALGDTVGGNQYDFQAVAQHELLHGLGFLSGLESPTGMNRNWTTFDGFLSTANGTDVIGANYVWDPAYTANLTGANGGLYFAGPATVAFYGRPVPLYTPGTWTSGTSLTHLDPTMPGGNAHVMNPFEDRGPGVRTISALELAMLTDLGYTVSPTYAFVLIGFGLRRRRRQPPIRVRHWSRFDTL